MSSSGPTFVPSFSHYPALEGYEYRPLEPSAPPSVPGLWCLKVGEESTFNLDAQIAEGLGKIQKAAESLVGKPPQEDVAHAGKSRKYWHYESPFSRFWWPSFSYHSHSPSRSRESRDDVATMIFFGIASLAASLFLGQEWGKLQGAKKGLDQVKKFETVRIGERPCRDYIDAALKNQIEVVVEKAEKTFSSVEKRSQGGVIRRTILLASLLLGFSGAVVASPELIAMASLSAFATSCVMLFKYGSNRGTDERKIDKLHEVQSEIATIIKARRSLS